MRASSLGHRYGGSTIVRKNEGVDVERVIRLNLSSHQVLYTSFPRNAYQESLLTTVTLNCYKLFLIN